jgi:hypothetical protein
MFWSTEESVAFVLYYVLAIISIIGNGGVVVYLLCNKEKYSSPFNFVVWFLHFSLVIEEVTSLPYLFNSDDTLCIVVEYIHYYAALMNIVSIILLVQVFRGNTSDEKNLLQKFLQHYGIYLILFLPVICFFQFLDTSTSTNTHPASPWCSFHHGAYNHLFSLLYFCTYYLCIWIGLVHASLRIFHVMYTLSRQTNDWKLVQRYAQSIGLYVVGMLVAWLPFTILLLIHTTLITSSTVDDTTHGDEDYALIETIGFAAYFPLYVIGILYVIAFWRDSDAVLVFDTFLSQKDAALGLNTPFMDQKQGNLKQRGSNARAGESFSNKNPLYQPPIERTSSMSTTRPSILQALFSSRQVASPSPMHKTSSNRFSEARNTGGFPSTIPENEEVSLTAEQQHALLQQQQQQQYSYSTTSSSLKRLTMGGSGRTNASASTVMFDSDLLRMIDTLADKPDEARHNNNIGI